MPKAAAAVDLAEFEAKNPAARCWYRRLTDDQRAKVDAAREAGYSGNTIAKVVTDWGIKITCSPVYNHYSSDHGCG